MAENQKVDVLSLYDTLIDECCCGDHTCEGCLQLIDAKLAVAELIQENKQLRIKANNWDALLHAREVTKAEDEDSQWKRLARGPDLIAAVKACRTAHGFSLREAKDCVEGYIARVQGG